MVKFSKTYKEQSQQKLTARSSQTHISRKSFGRPEIPIFVSEIIQLMQPKF